MKIKIDKYIGKKLSEVAAAAVLTCIRENKITSEFELGDIKGKAQVGITSFPMMGYVAGGKGYAYNIELFENIILVAGGSLLLPNVKDIDMAASQIKNAVQMGISAMIAQDTTPAVIQQRVTDAIQTTLRSPNTEANFILLDDLEVTLQYHQTDDKYGYFVDIATSTKTIGKHYAYGDSMSEVTPFVTGVLNTIVIACMKYLQTHAPKEIYISETTVFTPSMGMQFGYAGYPTAMINNPQVPAGYGYPMEPNLSSQNHGGIGGLSPDDINNRF